MAVVSDAERAAQRRRHAEPHGARSAHRRRQAGSHRALGDLLQLDRGRSAAGRSEPVALAARLGGADGDDQLGITTGGPPPDPNAPPRATFFDIGANIEGGPPFQDWARDLRAQRMADNQKDNPDANCLPMGFMQLHGHPQPRKIVQTPELIVIMYEGNQGLRQIFMDGRELPEVNEDLQPWWYGYSVGRWEGDTLVVESVGLPRRRLARRVRQPADGRKASSSSAGAVRTSVTSRST